MERFERKDRGNKTMKIMEDIKQLLTATKVKWALEDHRA